MLRNAGVARAQTLRRTRRVAALTLMLIAIGIMGVTPDGTGFLQPIDSWLSGIFHVSGWRPTALGTALGSPLLIAIAATIALAIHVRPGPSIRRPFGPVAIAAIAGAVAWVPAVMIRRPSPGHLGDLSASNAMSFPSIPAAMVTGLAIAFLWQTALKPRRAERIMGAVTVVCAVILFRLATACSWPLDELAGAVIGAVVAHVPRPRVGRDRSHRHGHSRRVKAAVALTAVVALLPATESYADIMTAPGSAPFDQRSVEWLRDHGMTQLI
ncbi:MAG: hypothetical protein JWN99_617, partial [Ilumatobacteraceae bacterium]|nr:hypothetical protein [Ilumatobacteraceae bacterium]